MSVPSSSALPNLNKVLGETLRQSELQLCAQLKSVRETIAETSPSALDASTIYEVFIDPHFEGHSRVEECGKGPLRGVVKRAIDRFKEVNRTSDVQAKYHAFAKIGSSEGEYRIAVPEEYLSEIFEEDFLRTRAR